jgi:hypothetical protein
MAYSHFTTTTYFDANFQASTKRTAFCVIRAKVSSPISAVADLGSLNDQIPLLDSSSLAPPFFVSDGTPISFSQTDSA